MPKVLIVDDEPHIRLLLEQTLEDFEEKGVKIITAGNGKQALELIKKETPDIVYLDVMMPEMNGYDVCNAVKNDPTLKGVYIILLTAKGQEYDKKMGDDSGADIYMTKPFNPDVIIAKTASILNITL
ncbi:MAG: two-component system response regulator [Planctomycetes bacterium RBG_16_41_13]|nr:MAG: two-component system response regulator [Planctomycetes bacterium RBG_16_41_13]